MRGIITERVGSGNVVARKAARNAAAGADVAATDVAATFQVAAT